METHYFWGFFVVALLVGFVLGSSIAGMTGFAVWPWQQQTTAKAPVIKDGVLKQPGSTLKPALTSLQESMTISSLCNIMGYIKSEKLIDLCISDTQMLNKCISMGLIAKKSQLPLKVQEMVNKGELPSLANEQIIEECGEIACEQCGEANWCCDLDVFEACVRYSY